MTSYIALFISMGAFGFTLFNWNHARQRDKRDLFLRLHELLLEADLQRGRRIALEQITSPEDAKAMRDANPDDYDTINRAMAFADLFALYAYEGYIDHGMALGTWKYAFDRLRAPAEHFMEHRRKMNGDIAWPNLRRFCEEAERSVATEAAARNV